MATRRTTTKDSAQRALVSIGPRLTRAEIRELKRRAEADLRTVGNYVTQLVKLDLKGPSHRRRRRVEAPNGRRASYNVNLYLSTSQTRKLEGRARAEDRSLSGYVATVILEDLKKG